MKLILTGNLPRELVVVYHHCYPACMAEPRAHSKPGAINENVGKNLLRMRNSRKTPEGKRATTAYVAERVRDMGVPMSASTITKIEKGLRRVTVDELVALAAVLDVSPVTLLLHDVDSVTNIEADVVNTSKPVQLTEKVSVPWETAWRWAHGTDQLPGHRSVSQSKFFEENRPYDRGMKYEIERVLMDQVPAKNRPAVVVGIIPDDARAPEVTIYTGANAEREARRQLGDGGAG